MKTTFNPQIIYEVFDKYGFPVLRIDNFDKGTFAKIRTELKKSEYMSVEELQDVVIKLSLIEKNENIEIKIVNIDMIHKTMRVDIFIKT
jgi:hypothetical protein